MKNQIKDIRRMLFSLGEVYDCCAFTFLDWKGKGKMSRFNDMPIGEKTKITVGDNLNFVMETLQKLEKQMKDKVNYNDK
jgi:hypothetical protein